MSHDLHFWPQSSVVQSTQFERFQHATHAISALRAANFAKQVCIHGALLPVNTLERGGLLLGVYALVPRTFMKSTRPGVHDRVRWANSALITGGNMAQVCYECVQY